MMFKHMFNHTRFDYLQPRYLYTIKLPNSSIPYHTLIMNKSVMLSLLNRANTGNEMLVLIDSFDDTQTETVEYTNSPTLEHIEF